MEENPPRYLHTKYEKFLTSGCRVISNQKLQSKTWLQKGLTDEIMPRRTDGWKDRWTDRWTEEWTNGTDKNYIPLRHTLYTGGIIRTGNNSVNTCDRVTVLALCTSSDGRLSMYEVSFNSLLYFLRYAPDKVFIAKIKGSNSVNTGDRIMALAFCNSLMALYQCIKFH